VISDRHRAALAAIARLTLFERLAPFTPVLAGTIPLGIDLPQSDLDIICHVADLDQFEALLIMEFGHLDSFAYDRKEKSGLPTLVAHFICDGFAFELFGQDRPVHQQNAYLHMMAEARLLALAGGGATAAIRQLKAEGLKTEPAFGHYFGLQGDPYEQLLAMATAPDEELKALVAQRRL
jgi:hypothetical protein